MFKSRRVIRRQVAIIFVFVVCLFFVYFYVFCMFSICCICSVLTLRLSLLLFSSQKAGMGSSTLVVGDWSKDKTLVYLQHVSVSLVPLSSINIEIIGSRWLRAQAGVQGTVSHCIPPARGEFNIRKTEQNCVNCQWLFCTAMIQYS